MWANIYIYYTYIFELLEACKFLFTTTHIVFFLKTATVGARVLCNKNGQTQFYHV